MICPFCYPEDVIVKNLFALAIYDKYPVSPGHILVIPIRHVESYFDTTAAEKIAIIDMIDRCKSILDEKYSPHGYNLGINCGRAAGQTVMHVHLHIIPRYHGDIDDPAGGVRGVIPGKRIYTFLE